MNVVDSSGWLEYFADGPNADLFAPAVEDLDELIVPVIACYEVFKRLLSQRHETAALQAIAHMGMGRIADVDCSLAIDAARLSVTHRLPMADSLILATAHRFDATLWTQDGDFRDLPGVRFFEPS